MTETAVTGCRVPRRFFETRGEGESDITVHAGSYHLALRDAGIEMANIVTYSSILPGIARRIEKPDNFRETFTHGAVLESIQAVANVERGERATAGIIYAWLYDETGRRHGGLVCEYGGSMERVNAEVHLGNMLSELYCNGYADRFTLSESRRLMCSFVPEKAYGTALVSLCFTDYEVPILERRS